MNKVLQSRSDLIVILPAMALVIAFYFWTALSNGNAPETASNFYYPLLGRALVDGQLSLEVVPAPELLALPDPYDPISNRPYRLHDASLYHGKYYIYFGPTPAVLLFAPYYLLTLDDFPQKAAVALFCSLGFIFSAWLFLSIVRDHFPGVPVWLRLAGVLSLGLADTCPFLLRRPDVYEAAISCAYFLAQLAFLSFYAAVRRPRLAWTWLLLTSACLGASVGARPNYVFAVFVFMAFLIGLWRDRTTTQKQGSWRVLLALAPVVLIGLLLAAYNYARFDNPFEFGQRYQLAGINVHNLPGFMGFSNVACNFWFYFLCPPNMDWHFPFLHAFPNAWFTLPGSNFGVETVTGLFVVSPISLFALTLPILLRKRGKPLALTLLFIAFSSLATLLSILSFNGTTMRYLVDFAPTFIFLGCLMACHFHQAMAAGKRTPRLVFQSVLAIILFLGCWNGLLLSFTGYYNFLQIYSPDTYAALEYVFQPVGIVMKFISNLFTS